MKLLVNAPTGRQELIEVGNGGGYFDPARVLWDENIDGPMPAVTLGAMVRAGSALVVDSALLTASTAISKAASVVQALLKIDADTDKIYGDVVGNKGEEYRSAEADAKAFIAASFTGTAGGGVTSWATAKGWTTTQAANDIITQAAAWRGAQAAIRSNRLAKKEAVKAAVDMAAINTVMAQWTGFAAAIRTQLGV